MLWMTGSVDAAPILISPGESVTFNFDFVAEGVSPAPPYEEVVFFPNPKAASKTTDGSWEFFSELNGLGTSVRFVGSDLPGNQWFTELGILDGVFSVVATMGTGFVTVQPTAAGFLNEGELETEAVFAQVATVPEPATVTLFGGGLAALFLRRRHRQSETP
jgi:hypothetical protein